MIASELFRNVRAEFVTMFYNTSTALRGKEYSSMIYSENQSFHFLY